MMTKTVSLWLGVLTMRESTRYTIATPLNGDALAINWYRGT